MLTPDSIMPFGSHRGKPLKDVPHSWFTRMHDLNKLSGDLKKYAEENVPILKWQAEKRKGKE